MAAAVAFRNYLETALGFDGNQSSAVTDQGFDDPEEFRQLTDSDVDRLCATIRRPGGQVAGNPNPGVLIGQNHALRLKQLAYYLRYLHAANRPWSAAAATRNVLRTLWEYKLQIDEVIDAGNPDFPEKFTTSKKARETIENMEAWIHSSYGLERLPLAYLVRTVIDVADPGDDPLGYGQPLFHEELIRRASHNGAVYAANNEKLWLMVRHVTHGTEAWSFVKGNASTKNGRAAFHAIKSQYTGASHVNQVKLEADCVIATTFWNGKACNFTWQGFVARLTSAFTDLADNGEARSENSKVRTLLDVITDPKLQVAKGLIAGDDRRSNDYQLAVDFLGGQLAANESSAARNPLPRNISSMSQNDNSGRGGGRGYSASGRGGRGSRNQGRGRGGGRSRGGRGRGGGSRFSESGHLLNNGAYPPIIWATFTKEERDHVNEQRARNR